MQLVLIAVNQGLGLFGIRRAINKSFLAKFLYESIFSHIDRIYLGDIDGHYVLRDHRSFKAWSFLVTDQEKKDLAQAYRTMLDMAAWKHFKAMVLDRIEVQAIKDEDLVPIIDLNPAMIGECRGRRNAIRKINSDLDYILEGLK